MDILVCTHCAQVVQNLEQLVFWQERCAWNITMGSMESRRFLVINIYTVKITTFSRISRPLKSTHPRQKRTMFLAERFLPGAVGGGGSGCANHPDHKVCGAGLCNKPTWPKPRDPQGLGERIETQTRCAAKCIGNHLLSHAVICI